MSGRRLDEPGSKYFAAARSASGSIVCAFGDKRAVYGGRVEEEDPVDTDEDCESFVMSFVIGPALATFLDDIALR
jgi:hypothetical protein